MSYLLFIIKLFRFRNIIKIRHIPYESYILHNNFTLGYYWNKKNNIILLLLIFYNYTDDSTTPYFMIESPHPIVALEFNHRDSQCLAGGLMSGQVAFWDIRKSSTYAAISKMGNGHRDPVRSLRWINSKTSTEFYTGSSDGQV